MLPRFILANRSRYRLLALITILGSLAFVLWIIAAMSTNSTEGAPVAAILHDLSTLLVLANAGRLLRFQEDLPRI